MGKIKSTFVTVLLTSAFIVVGCVKKRPDQEAQNERLGELYSTQAVLGWTHSISTYQKGFQKADGTDSTNSQGMEFVTAATTLEVEDNVTFSTPVKTAGQSTLVKRTVTDPKTNTQRVVEVEKKETFPLNIKGNVSYKSENSPFLQNQAEDVRVTYGELDATYPIVYELTENLLLIFKKVPASKIAIQELPIAIRKGGDFYVILGTMNVEYYDIQYSKNENNRNTNVKKKWEIPKEQFKSAPYFKVTGALKRINRTHKLDFLPADYFTNGEWYYAKAIVSTKPGDENRVGAFEGGLSTAFEFANKIRFRAHPGYLRGVNVAIAEQKKRVQKKDGQADDDVIAIPVEWTNSRIEDASHMTLGETFNNLPSPLTMKFERYFGYFDFVNTTTLARSTIAEAMASRVIRDVMVDDLHIGKDGFSFTLAKVATGEKTRYAFKRVMPSSYQPLIYRKLENDTFGAFYTAKPYVVTSRDDRKGDMENTILINRFNPEKKILFRFSKDTPKLGQTEKKPDQLRIDVRQIGRRCVSYWNRAFEVAGTNVKVEIEKDKDGNEIDGEVGDINSNIINIIDTLNESGLAGIGPSLADPESGEIVAGAANVYVAAYRSGISDRLRNYIRVKSGLARDYAFSKEIQNERPLMANTVAEVDYYCPDLRDFAVSLKGQPQYTSERENPYIDRCLEKLLPRVLSEVTCHEMGHVFGLRHNFECSADKDNSYKSYAHLQKVFPKKDFPEIYTEFYPKSEFFPQSSCLMDYMPDNRPMLMVPGLYDIAALAFIYAGKVEAAGTRDASPTGFGKLTSIDRSIPLNEQKAFKASQKFAFCDDYEAGTNNAPPINPMCMRHDFGNTPLTIMNHYFDSFRDDVVLNFRRWDRSSARESGRPWYNLENLTSVYKLWRAHLYDFVGRDNAHLHNVTDEESYTKLKNDLNTRFSKTDFLGVNELFARLMSSIVDIPDLYCVAVQGEPGQGKINRNTDVKLVNFKMAFDGIISAGVTEKVEGCDDPALSDYVSKKLGAKWKVQGEIGYPTDNLQFSRAKNDKWEGVDIIGLKEIRKDAMARLTSALGSDRVYELKVRNNFSPHALDEPFIYNAMKNKVEQRLFEGIDVSGPVTQVLEAKGFRIDDQEAMKPVKKFEADWQIYKQAYEQFRFFRKTEEVPDEVKVRADNPYTVGVSRDYNKRMPHEAFYYYPRDRVYFFSSAAAPSAYKVINTLRELDEPVRFDLGYNDPSSQEGMWQVAELVSDLPVTVDHNRRFDLSSYMAFSKKMNDILNSSYTDPSLKSSPIWPLLEKLQKFSQRLESLTIAANSLNSGSAQAAEDSNSEHLSPAVAKKLLTELENSESKFMAYFTLHTGGLNRSQMNQVNLMEQWIDSRPNTRLRADWRSQMLPEVQKRLRFMVEEPKEYEEHRISMLSLLVSLNGLSRDPL